MKLTFLLLTVCILNVCARGVSQKVTFYGEKVPLKSVFLTIEKQTGFLFLYKEPVIRSSKPVTVRAENLPLDQFLALIFKSQLLQYEVKGRSILVSLKPASEPASDDVFDLSDTTRNPMEFKGRVLDEKGDPVAGATIMIVGANKGTITNKYGAFSMYVAAGTMIRVTYQGSLAREIKLTAKQSVLQDIILSPSVSKLDELVIIPYGTSSARFLTGNISKITAEEIAKQPVANLLQALQGRIPGLIVNQQSGVPGSNFTVQIRGQNSILNGNTPLYIIDGVPYSSDKLNQVLSGYSGAGNSNAAGSAAGDGGLSTLNSINPADLESIEVLKDADATAIYGSRGANGVILITTKKAKAGPARLAGNVNSGKSQITRVAKYMNTEQYLAMRNEALKNSNATPSPFDYDINGTWDKNKYTNFGEKLIGNPSSLTNAQLSVSGGTQQTQYQIGADYSIQKPPYGGDFSDERVGLRFNLSNSFLDNKLRMTLTGSYSVDNNTLPGLDLASTIDLPPNAPDFLRADGSLIFTDGLTNPYASLLTTYRAKTKALLSNIQISYQVTPELQLRSSMGYTNTMINEVRTNPVAAFSPFSFNLNQGNSNFGSNTQTIWIFEPQAEYKRQLFGGTLSVLAGGTLQGNLQEGQMINATFYSDAFLNNLNAATSKTIFNSYSNYRYSAVFSRIGYNLSNKYLLNLTGRRDGSSRFGPDKQFANFGAVGAGWIFSEEGPIKKGIPFLSFGKLRGSYGITGNDQIGDYKYLDSYTANSNFSYQGVPGLNPTRVFNSGYTWESNKKLEGGLELGFFKDRIILSASWYRNRSSNQLVLTPLAPTTGNQNVQSNLPATVQNKGWEFELTSTNIKHNHFTWRTSANLSVSRNKLISFPGLERTSYANTYIVGQPVSILKLFKLSGVNPQTGIYQFEDRNGKLTSSPVFPADQIVIYNANPKFYGGMLNGFTYKGFQLDVFIQFVKQKGKNLLSGLKYSPGAVGNLPVEFLDRWQKPGDVKPYQKVEVGFGQGTIAGIYANNSDQSYQDASYIRVKNVALSYSFNQHIMKLLHANALKIYLQAQNLITITKYIGADPETQGSVLPPLQTVTAGIQFTF